MRIAIFHELDFGGAKRAVVEFAKRLKKDHIVDLYYVDANKDNNAEDSFNKTYFYKFNSKTWKGNNWRIRLYKDTIELINLFKLHRKISIDIKNKEYDHIFVHPSKYTQSPFLLRFIKNKCIYYCQEPLRIVYDFNLSDTSSMELHNRIYEFVIRKIRKWIDLKNLKSASIILANSNYSKEFINKSYGITAKVCYLGVDSNLFKKLNIKKKVDVLFIGNRDIGYDLLNKSEGHFRVKAIFRQDGESGISDKELVELYNKAKVLVALNKNEPFGLIPLEAMSCGTPVIAVAEGGYRESVINNKTGFLIRRDSGELFSKINEIIDDAQLRNKMGKNARENVLQKWTWEKSVKRFLEIIKHDK